VRVEPRFDVGEQAAVDLQMWLQAAHEVEDCAAVPLADLFAGIKAEANVVVAPDTHRFHFLKQPNRLLDVLARLENVAQDTKCSAPCCCSMSMAFRNCFVCSWMSANNPSFIGYLPRLPFLPRQALNQPQVQLAFGTPPLLAFRNSRTEALVEGVGVVGDFLRLVGFGELLHC
jgi:hypothetical protein